MRRQILILGISCILMLSSCAPKVVSNMAKTYPSLPQDSPVEVYFANNLVPSQAEVLGEVSVKDSGASINCDSTTVINRIKEESRKAGGNAIIVLNHTKPSIWSTCHQMEAAILNVSDFSNLATTDGISPEQLSTEYKKTIEKGTQEKKERLLPRFQFNGDFGYGWRTAKLNPSLEAEERNYLKKLMNGPAWNLSAGYYFNDSYGIGLSYSTYSSSNSIWATNTDSGDTGKLKTNDIISFVGPTFLMRFSHSQKWIFGMQLGLGYISYSSKTTFLNENVKQTGASVGVLASFNTEYKFAKNWGIGADLSSVGGTLSSFDVNTNGRKETINLSNEEREGLGHIKISLGVRYYIK